jgi:hypothetical protein
MFFDCSVCKCIKRMVRSKDFDGMKVHSANVFRDFGRCRSTIKCRRIVYGFLYSGTVLLEELFHPRCVLNSLIMMNLYLPCGCRYLPCVKIVDLKKFITGEK